MKFTYAWASLASQNVVLKLAVACLSVVAVALSATSVKLALRDALVIERGCTSTAVMVSSSPHPTEEIEAFIKEAISQRYNSDSKVTLGYLSSEEEQSRVQEQKELAARGMSQKMIVNKVTVSTNTITVDADRLISAGQIRSAFVYPLVVNIKNINRTLDNPYGLTLAKATSPPKGQGG